MQIKIDLSDLTDSIDKLAEAINALAVSCAPTVTYAAAEQNIDIKGVEQDIDHEVTEKPKTKKAKKPEPETEEVEEAEAEPETEEVEEAEAEPETEEVEEAEAEPETEEVEEAAPAKQRSSKQFLAEVSGMIVRIGGHPKLGKPAIQQWLAEFEVARAGELEPSQWNMFLRAGEDMLKEVGAANG